LKQAKTGIALIISLTMLLIISGCTSQPPSTTTETEEPAHYGTFTTVSTATIPTTLGDNEVTIMEDPNTGCQCMMDITQKRLVTMSPLYNEQGAVAGCRAQTTEPNVGAS